MKKTTKTTSLLLTPDTLIRDVIRLDPKRIKPVFARYNLYCAGCHGAVSEPLRFVAQNYGIDLNRFMAELTKAIG